MPRIIRIALPLSFALVALFAAVAFAQVTAPTLTGGSLVSPAPSDDAKSASALRTNFRSTDVAVRTWLTSPSLQTRPASRASLKSRRSVKPAVVWVP